MKFKLVFLLLTLTIASTAQVSDSVKLKMACAAFTEGGSSPIYVVVKVKNLNTSEVKEICTLGTFLRGAITREQPDFSIHDNSGNIKDLYFEFASDSALWNISFDRYTENELFEYANTVSIPDSVAKFKKGELIQITFPWRNGSRSKKKECMFAHLMFNAGILPRSSSRAGNIMEFTDEY